ncbi:MAG TPA: hypothetical protein VL135_06625 [Terracidiphilus sp.]|jgi:hypothetical protein|nr:hypothetical protein [Terracidiphilus sp.]
MKNIGKWVLGAAVLAGGLTLGTTKADAAQWRVTVGVGNPAYIPPCPGPGYAWVNGYYDGGYWVPGYWNYVGGVSYSYYDRGAYRHYDRDDYRRFDRDHDRRFYDRDDHRRFDRDEHRDRNHDRWRR